MPRLEFDSVKNGTNLRKHGISLDRFGDMDFDAALVAEDVSQQQWDGDALALPRSDRWRADVGIVTIAAARRESSACAARAAMNESSMSKHPDDAENPELDTDFFARAKHGLDHVPDPMRTALRDEQTRRRGRGPQRTPTKKLVSLRLDPDVVIAYRNTGRGWQSRMNAALKRTVRTKPTPHLAGTVVEAAAARGRQVIARKAAKKR